MDPLDWLFLPLGDEKFKQKKVSEKVRNNDMNAKTILWLLAIGGLGFGMLKFHVNPLGFLGGDDIHTIIEQDQDMVTLYGQFKRYCEPNPVQRFGNGFDASTCKDKLDAMVSYRANKQNLAYMGPNADQDMRIDQADQQFRGRLGNIHQLETGGMH